MQANPGPPRPASYSLLIAFVPPLLVLYLMVVPVVLAFAIGNAHAQAASLRQLAPDLVAIVLIVIVPLVCGIVAWVVGSRLQSPLLQVLAVYAGIQPTGLGITFMVSTMLAGASMAVVEGVVTGWELKAQELFFALVMLLPLQVVLLPWALLATFVARRTRGARQRREGTGPA